MTRGKIIGVFPDEILESTEFNGDMSPSALGIMLLEMVDGCSNKEKYEYAIYKLDFRFFGCGEKTGKSILNRSVKRNIDLREYSYGYCDYLYLSNHSGNELAIIDRAGKVSMIPEGETAIYHYYEYLTTAAEAKQKEEERMASIYGGA